MKWNRSRSSQTPWSERIAARLSQKELAERLGLKEQQIQKYEATGYSGASLGRMTEVVNALGLRVRKEVFLPVTADTQAALLRGLAEIGFDRKFIERRLLPNRAPAETSKQTVGDDGFVFQAATRAGRILGVSPAALLDAEPLTGNRLLAATKFKVPAGANEQRLTAYTFYAHYLALLILQATAHLQVKPVPTDAKTVRAAILAGYGEADFASVLRFIWDNGVAVLPLDDPGAFHGACWRANQRNVIALKRRTPLLRAVAPSRAARVPARWRGAGQSRLLGGRGHRNPGRAAGLASGASGQQVCGRCCVGRPGRRTGPPVRR